MVLVDDFLILPNPNTGKFTLEYGKGIYYQIFDGLGRMVANGALIRNINDRRFSQPIHVEGLDNGLYFLKVFDNYKFVKIKKLLISGK